MPDAIEDYLTQARAARGEGRSQDARNAYARAAALSREQRRPLEQAGALWHLADIDLEAGHVHEAMGHAEQAAALYREHAGEPLDLANALRLQALSLDELRRTDQAVAAWTAALDLYRADDVAAGVAECEARLAR